MMSFTLYKIMNLIIDSKISSFLPYVRKMRFLLNEKLNVMLWVTAKTIISCIFPVEAIINVDSILIILQYK